jgi:thiol-disulfide isomerase/thioredoxin
MRPRPASYYVKEFTLKMKTGILLALALLAQAGYAAPAEKVTMYFFWGQGCPHCALMEPFIEKMQEKYPNLEVKSLEVFNNKDNVILLDEMAQAYSTNATVVPDVFISDRMIIGYNGPNTENTTESLIINCSQKKCASPDDMLAAYRSKPVTTSSTAPASTTTSTIAVSSTTSTTTPVTKTTIPRDQVANGSIVMYFFYGDGCPHCAQMEPFIQTVIKAYPQVNVKSLEVFNNESNARFFDTMAKAYRRNATGVPTTFIGDQMIEGYVTKDNETSKEVTGAIDNCTEYGCPSPDQSYEAYVKEHPTTTTVMSTTRPVQESTTTTQPTVQGKGNDATILIILAVVIVLIAALALLLRKGGKKTEDGNVKKGEAE